MRTDMCTPAEVLGSSTLIISRSSGRPYFKPKRASSWFDPLLTDRSGGMRHHIVERSVAAEAHGARSVPGASLDQERHINACACGEQARCGCDPRMLAYLIRP